MKSSSPNSSLHKTKECSRSLSINPFVDCIFPPCGGWWRRRTRSWNIPPSLRSFGCAVSQSHKHPINWGVYMPGGTCRTSFLILLNELQLKKSPTAALFLGEAQAFNECPKASTDRAKGKLASRRTNKLNAFHFFCAWINFILFFQKVRRRSSNKVPSQKGVYLYSSRRLNNFRMAGGVRGASPRGGT